LAREIVFKAPFTVCKEGAHLSPGNLYRLRGTLTEGHAYGARSFTQISKKALACQVGGGTWQSEKTNRRPVSSAGTASLKCMGRVKNESPTLEKRK